MKGVPPSEVSPRTLDPNLGALYAGLLGPGLSVGPPQPVWGAALAGGLAGRETQVHTRILSGTEASSGKSRGGGSEGWGRQLSQPRRGFGKVPCLGSLTGVMVYKPCGSCLNLFLETRGAHGCPLPSWRQASRTPRHPGAPLLGLAT